VVDLVSEEQTPPFETPPPPLTKRKKDRRSSSSNNNNKASSRSANTAQQEAETKGSVGRTARSSKKSTQLLTTVDGSESGVPTALKIVAPQTPATTNMDSDDDFRSMASSNAFDEVEDQDSDVSLDACKFTHYF